MPDELYRDLKALARKKEWTMAETVRRSLEEYLERHPAKEGAGEKKWTLPKPMNLGPIKVGPEEMRLLANERDTPEDLLR